MSLIVTSTLSPVLSSARLNVSAPSSELSAVTLNDLLFTPTVKLPVRLTPPISALDTPLIVYGMVSAFSVRLFEHVIEKLLPSSQFVLLAFSV